jgi:hypothetical protein
MSIFLDMIEEIVEVFMDDFSFVERLSINASRTWIGSCKDVKKRT